MKQLLWLLFLVPSLWAQNQNLGNVTVNNIQINGHCSGNCTSTSLVLPAENYCTTPGTLDQSCINNAIAACASQLCTVVMRAGTWNISSTISFNTGGQISLRGSGQSVTLLTPPSTMTTDVLSFFGGGDIDDMTIGPASGSMTSGACIHITQAANLVIRNVSLRRCADGLKSDYGDNLSFYNLWSYNNRNNGVVLNCPAGQWCNQYIFDSNTTITGNGNDGILFESLCPTCDNEALIINGSQIAQNGANGIEINASSGAKAINFFLNPMTDLDINGNDGLFIQGVGQIQNVNVNGIWACGSGQHGADFGLATVVNVWGGEYHSNGGDGLRVAGQYVNINDVNGHDNGNAFWDVDIQSTAGGVAIHNGRYWNSGKTTGGIAVGSGATNVKIFNPDFSQIGTGTPLTNNGGTQVEFDNVPRIFSLIGTPANGSHGYCADCTVANPCAGAGTGAMYKVLNGVKVCN